MFPFYHLSNKGARLPLPLYLIYYAFTFLAIFATAAASDLI